MSVVGSVAGFLLSIALARILGSESYGHYAFVFSLVAFIVPFAVLGLSDLLTREVAAAYATRKWGLIQGLLTGPRLMVATAVVTVGVVGFALLTLLDWEDPIDLSIYAFALLAMAAISQDSVTAGQMRGLLEVTTSSLPQTLIRPFGFLLALLTGNWVMGSVSASSAMLLHAMAAFTATLIGYAFLRRTVRRKVEDAAPVYLTRKWLLAGVPFMLYGGLHAAGTQLPIIILGFVQASEEVALLRVAVSFSLLTQFFHGVLSRVAQPEFARLHALGDRAGLQRLTTKVVRIGLVATVPLAGAFIGLGLPLLELFYGPEYAAAYPSLVVLVIAQLVNVTLGPVGILLTMTHHERYAVQALGIYTAVAGVASLLLAPLLGAIGGAIAYAISMITLELTLAFRVSQKLSVSLVPWASGKPERSNE